VWDTSYPERVLEGDMNTPKEVEFKYSASEISIESFHKFCKGKKGLVKYVMASGFDHFYASTVIPGAFCRHRQGADMNQLTLKRKTTHENSYVRTEHNIDLDPTMTEPQIRSLCNDLGYTYTGRIFKVCFVYKYDYYTLCYYVVYDDNMKELNRFFEIEMSEEVQWREGEAYSALVIMEKSCKLLGAKADNRESASLFEMYGHNHEEKEV
jgi:adenylate cyclase class IV